MKVLVFCYEFPPIGAGAGNAVYHLAEEWSKAGHEITVVTSKFRDLPDRETVSGIHVRRVWVGRRRADRGYIHEMLIFMVWSALYAACLPKDGRPDVSVSFLTVPSGIGPWVLRALYGVPMVTEIRGGDVPGFYPEALRRHHRYAGWLIRLIWNASRAIVANGSGLEALARSSGTRRPVYMIPNGVDPNRFYPPESKSRGETFTLLFAGRFVDSQKNIMRVCELLSEWDDIRLILAGDGPDRKRIEQFILQNEFGNRVFLSGWLKGDALREIYQRADVYVSASRWEGMPNSALEAMACGLPLILSRIPGHTELIEEGRNGFLFDSEDAAALKSAVQKLRSDAALWSRMSAESRFMACERFDWRTLAEKHMAIYMNALKGDA